jgi:hypothetical protein
VPAGGNVITEAARAADRDLRALSEAYGMTDINSARAGERAKPKLVQTAEAAGPSHQFAPGFSAPLHRDRQGRILATCTPSTAGMTHKVKASAGTALQPNRSFPNPSAGARVEARHVGKP